MVKIIGTHPKAKKMDVIAVKTSKTCLTMGWDSAANRTS